MPVVEDLAEVRLAELLCFLGQAPTSRTQQGLRSAQAQQWQNSTFVLSALDGAVNGPLALVQSHMLFASHVQDYLLFFP
jgi:hypothetical protein